MDRRTFMKYIAGAGALMAGCSSDDEAEAEIVRTGWGTPPDKYANLVLDEAHRPRRVLEFFCMGGLNPWDTLYVHPEHGKPSDPDYPYQQWNTFQEGEENVREVFEACGGSGDLLLPFGTDSENKSVFLGPWLEPLWQRPDVLARTRILVMSHAFEPHQVAIPLMLCGHPRGSARMASTPSYVQRHLLETRDPNRSTPYGYVVYSGDTEIQDEFNVQAASASGLHPSSARPFNVYFMENNPLSSLLSRQHLGDWRNATDDAVDQYLRQYTEALGYGNRPTHEWSRILNDYRSARRNLRMSPNMTNILTEQLLSPMVGQECGETNPFDMCSMGVRMATNLLTRESDAAKYVTLVDTGFITGDAGGYDSHDYHVRESSRNVMHASRTLMDAINRPGEGDPRKLDLDKDMVLLTTDFGRTPYAEERRIRGLNHWPFGFAIAVIGGFVGEEQRGVVGSIGPDGVARHFITPGEFRASLLLSMGIWPFASDGFAIGDVRNANSEEEAARYLRHAVLGHPV